MTNAHKYLVKLSVRSLNLDKKLAQFINSQPGFEVTGIEDARAPDLLIIETGEAPEKVMQTIQALIAAGDVAEVFLTAEAADPGVLMQAMRSGVKEFLSQPIDADELSQALVRFKQRQQAAPGARPQKTGQVLTVFGSKGGVGTTTVAVNLCGGSGEQRCQTFRRASGHEHAFRRDPAVPGDIAQISLGRNHQEHRAPGRHLSVQHSDSSTEAA